MKVSELLTDESKWTQGYFARTDDGRYAMWDSPRAMCWCIHGAISKCYRNVDATVYAKIIKRATDAVGDLWNFNDAPERTFAEVRQLVEALDI